MGPQGRRTDWKTCCMYNGQAVNASAANHIRSPPEKLTGGVYSRKRSLAFITLIHIISKETPEYK